jgi:hypothetical protein
MQKWSQQGIAMFWNWVEVWIYGMSQWPPTSTSFLTPLFVQHTPVPLSHVSPLRPVGNLLLFLTVGHFLHIPDDHRSVTDFALLKVDEERAELNCSHSFSRLKVVSRLRLIKGCGSYCRSRFRCNNCENSVVSNFCREMSHDRRIDINFKRA